MLREPICYRCKHFFIENDTWKCEAFTEEKMWCKNQVIPTCIPFQILSGELDHSQPFPGDMGLRYEPKG